MGDWVTTWDRCFVQGCFTYDLAVQFVGTLGALGVALALYQISRRSDKADSKEESDERWRLFDAQAALTQRQLDHSQAEADKQQRRWHSEQRTHAMERELDYATQHARTANMVLLELQKMFAISQANSMFVTEFEPMGVAGLDSLTGSYTLLPGVGAVKAIKAAHDMAHVMASSYGTLHNSRDLYASTLDSAISTVSSLEKALADQIETLNIRLREEAGLRVELIEELAEFDRFFSEYEEAPEE